MTKRGFKSVTIPDSLHSILSSEAQKRGISIGKYLEERVLSLKPSASDAHVLSGLYYEPAKYIIPDTIAPEMVANARQKKYHTKEFKEFLELNKNLSNSTVQSHLLHAQIFYNSGLNVKDFLLGIKKTKSSATYKNYLATLKTSSGIT